jgi:uncharacterized protein involved in response to NO
MLFGFVAAAVAGFLLTAVPSWTGRRGFAGRPLMALVAVWLAGRVAMAPGLGIPRDIASVIDLAFLPTIALTILPAMLRAGNLRNLPLIAVLALLFLANLLFHEPELGTRLGIDGLMLAVNVLLVLVTLIGGRIVPAFTGNALRMGQREVTLPAFGTLDRVSLAAVLGVLLIDLVAPRGWPAGLVALVACLLHAWRLSRWQGWAARHEPIVWVLHVAYAWIPIALALKGAFTLWGVIGASAWIHALTTGTFATMILAVMTRAALGHTGRALVAPPVVVAAYFLITLSALTRVIALSVPSTLVAMTLMLAGVLWISAFSFYCFAYAPMPWRPRPDGEAG